TPVNAPDEDPADEGERLVLWGGERVPVVVLEGWPGPPVEGPGPTVPVLGREPTVPVVGREPTVPVEGPGPGAPVAGGVRTVPGEVLEAKMRVEGRVPAVPVEGRLAPEPHPRDSLVLADWPPLFRRRFWSGCHCREPSPARSLGRLRSMFLSRLMFVF